MPIAVGTPAPDFTLKGHDDKEYRLSDLRGQTVVLAFYPLDFSPVCSKEHVCFREDLAAFNAVGARVFGISVDSVWTHKAFAKELGLEFPLLADFQPRGAAAALYGLHLPEKGIDARATVIVDKNGVVRHLEVHDIPRQRDNAKILETIRSLG